MIASAAETAAVVAAAVIALVSLGFARSSAKAARDSADASRQAADATHRAALAQERVAEVDEERRADERADRTEQLALATESRELERFRALEARLHLRTERTVVVETAEETIYRYDLVVWNAGPADARDLAVQIVGCNGEQWQMPPRAARPDDLRVLGSLLAQREHRIELMSSGDQNCWDIAECVVRWIDGNGQREERLRVSLGF